MYKKQQSNFCQLILIRAVNFYIPITITIFLISFYKMCHIFWNVQKVQIVRYFIKSHRDQIYVIN